LALDHGGAFLMPGSGGMSRMPRLHSVADAPGSGSSALGVMMAADTQAFAANGYRFAKWHGKPNSENAQ
jgi:hypothetical protein